MEPKGRTKIINRYNIKHNPPGVTWSIEYSVFSIIAENMIGPRSICSLLPRIHARTRSLTLREMVKFTINPILAVQNACMMRTSLHFSRDLELSFHRRALKTYDGIIGIVRA
jgi:hypothetical protein